MAISQDTAALQAEIRQLAVLMRQQLQNQSALAQSTLHVADSLDDLTDRAHDEAKQLKASMNLRRRLSNDEQQLLEEYERARRKVLKEEEKILQHQKAIADAEALRHSNTISQAEFDRIKLLNEQKILDHTNRKVRREAEAAQVADKFKKAIGSITGKLELLVGILASVGGAVMNFGNKVVEASVASAGVIEETTGNFDQGMGHWMKVLALSGVEQTKMLGLMAENRQMVNALGGMQNVIDDTMRTVKDMKGVYGTMENSWRQNLAVMSNFANKGVKPTNEALVAYNKDLDMLARQTGMSGEAINTMINSIAEDADSITILRAARADEREAILANQRALLQNNIALGMTAKQAEEASKMLNKMVAQKPLDRLKQAAKMRALGYAMGLGPEAERAAVGMQKGKMASAQERADIASFSTAVTNLADQSAQQGIAQELFVSELLEKLDFNQYFGPNSSFSATLGNTNQSQLRLEAQYKSSSDSVIVSTMAAIEIAKQAVAAVMDGTLILGALLDSTRHIETILTGISGIFTTIADDFRLGWAGIQDGLEKLTGGFLFGGESDMRLHKEKAPKESRTDAEYARIQAEHGKQSTADTDAIINATKAKKAEQAAIAENAAATQKGATASEVAAKSATAAASQFAENKAAVAEPPPVQVEPVATPTAVAEPQSVQVEPVATPTAAPQPVTIQPDPVQQSTENSNRTRAEAIQQQHTDLLTMQVNRIDQQLQSMSDANKYLKTIADAVPTLVDLAGKQLAATTMSQEQRQAMAAKLGRENAKFSADYSYAM